MLTFQNEVLSQHAKKVDQFCRLRQTSEDINRFELKMLDKRGFFGGSCWSIMAIPSVAVLVVVGCACIYLEEEELQENYLENLTYIPEVCSEQTGRV